jgi:hypothetical protein
VSALHHLIDSRTTADGDIVAPRSSVVVEESKRGGETTTGQPETSRVERTGGAHGGQSRRNEGIGTRTHRVTETDDCASVRGEKGVNYLDVLPRDVQLIRSRLVKGAHRSRLVHSGSCPLSNSYTLYDSNEGRPRHMRDGSPSVVASLSVTASPPARQPQQAPEHHQRAHQNGRLVPSALMGEDVHNPGQHLRQSVP